MDRRIKHGLWNHPLYMTWNGMMKRCHQPGNPSFPAYGGRGITVCERWRNIVTFVADMASGHIPGLELDRINNDLGYSPDNCRWVTKIENRNNRRKQVTITIGGVTKTSAQWARENGVSVELARCRIKYYGWDPVVAVTTPTLDQHEVVSRATKVAATARTAAKEKRLSAS